MSEFTQKLTVSKEVSACAPTYSEADMELITPFIGETVIVKSEDYQIEGVLIGCLPSFHKALGSLIVLNESGTHYIRNWEIIGEKREIKSAHIYSIECVDNRC